MYFIQGRCDDVYWAKVVGIAYSDLFYNTS